jgi:hypothetical protein
MIMLETKFHQFHTWLQLIALRFGIDRNSLLWKFFLRTVWKMRCTSKVAWGIKDELVVLSPYFTLDIAKMLKLKAQHNQRFFFWRIFSLRRQKKIRIFWKFSFLTLNFQKNCLKYGKNWTFQTTKLTKKNLEFNLLLLAIEVKIKHVANHVIQNVGINCSCFLIVPVIYLPGR